MNLAETAVDAVRRYSRRARTGRGALPLPSPLDWSRAQRASAQHRGRTHRVSRGSGRCTAVAGRLCWCTADLFCLGDARALTAHGELRVRAEALQCRSILFTVRAMEVMLTLRAGRLDEAEAAADACYAMGVEVGDVDALAYYGGQPRPSACFRDVRRSWRALWLRLRHLRR